MKSCVIQREKLEGLDIVHLNGALDSQSFPRLDELLNTLYEHDRFKVILDCKDLIYMSSASLGALIGFSHQCRKANGDLKIANLSQKITNIVELLGFNKVLDIHPDTDTAIAAFENISEGQNSSSTT